MAKQVVTKKTKFYYWRVIMGNRAVITLDIDSKKRGVYVHWNGGSGSVQAFIEEARKRFTFSRGKIHPDDLEIEIVTFYSILYGLIRDYFAYNTEYPSRKPMSIYMTAPNGADGFTEDNGVYVIDTDFFCDRLNCEHNDHERNNLEYARKFFDNLHNVASEVAKPKMQTSTELYTTLVDSLNSVEKSGANFFKVEKGDKVTIIAHFDTDKEVCISYIEMYINEYIAQNGREVKDIAEWDFKYTTA